MGTVRRALSMLSDLGIGQRMRRRYCSRKRMHSTRSRKKRGNGHYILIEKVMNFHRSAQAPVTMVSAVSMNTIWKRKITITPTS